MEKTSYWVIAHGDPEVRCFWSGYKPEHKDHFFDRDPKNAIRFCRAQDAANAGVHLTKGIRIIEMFDP